ncbi:PREDICTED: BRICHOS domain-containing protein 5 [Pygoscelis adeliae]|nr:PREDICTED: BRICHOS domain-containing protein 5 [Pygoscelis adeliae]
MPKNPGLHAAEPLGESIENLPVTAGLGLCRVWIEELSALRGFDFVKTRCPSSGMYLEVTRYRKGRDRRAAARFAAPSRTFWIILSVALFFAAIGISVVGVLSFSPSSAQAGSQLVRLTLQGQQDPLRNQTALVDKSRSTVTYYVTSQSNHTAVVLYDSRNGYVCYKPVEQRACYLRRMDAWDLQTLQTSLNTSEQRADQMLRQNNQTKYYREFLGILAGEQVDPENLGEAVRTLCEQTSIFWVRRGEGPGKQRLIYLCIDICFPSNICVSICFYYLPE